MAKVLELQLQHQSFQYNSSHSTDGVLELEDVWGWAKVTGLGGWGAQGLKPGLPGPILSSFCLTCSVNTWWMEDWTGETTPAFESPFSPEALEVTRWAKEPLGPERPVKQKFLIWILLKVYTLWSQVGSSLCWASSRQSVDLVEPWTQHVFSCDLNLSEPVSAHLLTNDDNSTSFRISYSIIWASLVVLVIKNLPVLAGDVRDVGSIPWRSACLPTPVFLVWKTLWTEEPGGLKF